MNQETQRLYVSLSSEDRAKVDVWIHELLMRREENRSTDQQERGSN